ncbi:MAG TPA: type II toxin-antitoxin system RelE/ParE family toxin [Bdellovibrionota bacterium]|nr:type II toxin-antitoxin system RelE/ParE family toxin [Bdellovibrionota bacterium]
MPIQSFADDPCRRFFETGRVDKGVKWANAKGIVKRKLDMLHYAARLDDLRSPPGNRLEALKGSLTGLFSIRVNDQWRIVFRWSALGPVDVRVTYYHG